MFYLVYRICSSPLVLLPCLCLFMFPVNPVALKLENNWVTVSMSAVGAVQTFSQPGVPSYRILNAINGSVYIGGNETLLKLSIAGNRVVPSAEITLVTGELPATVPCVTAAKDLAENVCWNFIRVVESTSLGLLFVCGSNSFTPLCYRCPMDLETSSTCMPLSRLPVFTDRFVPDLPSTIPSMALLASTSGDVLYAGYIDNGIDFGSFVKYSLQTNLSSIDFISQQLQLSTIHSTGQIFIQIPTFVGKPFEYTDGSGTEYVFVVFREVAIEYDSSEVKEFSRIARVCKNDTGASRNTNTFGTYVKARLECSVSASDSKVLPLFYDDVQSFIWDEKNEEIYAVFTLSETAPPSSALCRYRIADIQTLFEGGDSKHQDNNVNHLWVAVSLIPTPGTCDEAHTINYPPLMDKLVPNYNPTEPTPGFQESPPANLINSDTPTLIVDGVRFTSLAIDFDYGCLYFFGTSTGSVMKVHKTTCSDAAEQFTAVEINDLGTSGAVTGLELLRNGTSKYLVITTDHTVITWPLTNNCTARSRVECETVRYPYCSWNGTECLCNASISDCDNVHVTTSDISTDLLQVEGDKTVTACYNHYVYWFCIIDSDDPFVQASGFNLTWSGPGIDNSLLVQTRTVLANVLELGVTLSTSTTGVFTCTANLGDGSSLTKDVELVQTVCETNDKISARCGENNSLKTQNEKLQRYANGETCSVQTQDCNSCPP